MSELRRDLDLARGTARSPWRPPVLAQDLDCHLPLMAKILREIHRGLATLSELTLDTVACRQQQQRNRSAGFIIGLVGLGSGDR